MKRENGLVFASYLIWGLLPLFWKQLSMVNSAYVLAPRIIWSAIFCGSLLLLRRRWNRVKIALADKGEVGLIFLCAILISINWGLYIFSIAIGKVLESSLAYYMSPIISSRLVAAESVTQAIPRAAARWAKIYCAMGLRQILPWQTKSSLIILNVPFYDNFITTDADGSPKCHKRSPAAFTSALNRSRLSSSV